MDRFKRISKQIFVMMALLSFFLGEGQAQGQDVMGSMKRLPASPPEAPGPLDIGDVIPQGLPLPILDTQRPMFPDGRTSISTEELAFEGTSPRRPSFGAAKQEGPSRCAGNLRGDLQNRSLGALHGNRSLADQRAALYGNRTFSNGLKPNLGAILNPSQKVFR